MNRRGFLLPGGAALLLLLLLPGCSSNNQADDPAPVYLRVDFKLLPALKNVADGALLQFDTVEVTSVLKNPGADASRFLDVQVEDYVIEWKRVDGGTAAPKPERFGGNFVVPAGGTTTLTNYPFMSISASLLPPLDQLFPYNGGLDRETGRPEIRCEGIVTFRGRTYAGDPVNGTGYFSMTFVYIAPQARTGAGN
ncbi:MAG: hypothetical protein EDX89_08845 [Acidobacteria bacterium]|nr:MAG: hypothetical protein EDX89_08845 [Acidobacteriota bacterium]